GLISHQQPKTEGDTGPAVPGMLDVRGHWMLDETSAAATRTGLGRGGLNVSVDRLDTSLSLEDLVRPIAPAVSSVIELQREAFGPSGRVDVALRVNQALRAEADTPGDPLRVDATIRNARNLSLLATTQAGVAPQRVNMLQDRGEIRILAAADDTTPVTLAFADLSAATSIDGQPLGRIELDGTLAIDTNAQTDATSVAEPLTLRLRDARFESVVVADLLRRYAPQVVNDRYASLKPVGQFDAELTAAPTVRDGDGARTGTLLQAALRPVDIAFTIGDTRYTLPNVSGQITLDNLTELVSADGSQAGAASSLPRGELQELTVVGDDWFGTIHGPWAITPGDTRTGESAGGWTLKATASLEASRSSSATNTIGLPDDLLAMLPPSVPAALQEYAVTLQSLAMRDVHLELSRLERSIDFKAAGAAIVQRLDLSRAVNVQNLSGVVKFDASGQRADEGPLRAEVDLALNATRARIEGLLLSGLSAEATLRTGDATQPTLVLHSASGALYGGRVSLSGALLPTPADTATNRPAEVQVAMAGVRLADVMTELSRRGRTVAGPPVPDSLELPLPSMQADDGPIADATRGVIDLDLALRASISNEPLQSLDGHGSLRIAQGSAIFDLPVVVGLIELSNLRLPSDDKFDYAAADFTLTGPRIGVQRIVMLSDALALIGAGHIDLPDGRLDLAVNSRSRQRLPIISAIIETIRDELLTASITGTIAEPSYTVSTLSGTRRAIARLFGAKDSGPSIPSTELDRYERDRHSTSQLLSPHRQAVAESRLIFDATAAVHSDRNR
nr:hypothetical protein [Phycisphaerales bacterium]